MNAFRSAVKKVVGSLFCTQPPPSEVVIHIDEIPKKPKIQRVPRMLRRVEANQKCYDPLVVSIGPFHYDKDLEIAEEHKRAMARQYAKDNDRLLEDLYDKVKAAAGEARTCYSEGSIKPFDDDKENSKFTKMMFLDGCFILQFIHGSVNGSLDMKRCLAMYVQQDLLLLENQLPFQVLRELMSLRLDVDWNKTFVQFINMLCDPLPSKISSDDNQKMSSQFEQCAHLLDMIQTMLINNDALTRDRNKKGLGNRFSCRSAKELKAVGIHFRPSESYQLTDVEFSSTLLISVLKLPPITIDDSTKSLLLNMVAFEACPDAPDDLGVSSYICFMDSLIDHAEDVKELRSKGILLNFLGSDQQVAELFNQIADNLAYNPCVYAEVKDRLEKHYKNKFKIWLAEWLHTHFTSPWTVLAFIGAIFALVLSVIQTYEAVYSTETTPCPCAVANRTI